MQVKEIELYKKIPKKMIKDKDIDSYLKNANLKKEKKILTLDDDMLNEIDYFISAVKEGLYSSPNKIISKEERRNWRFKVKKYYKLLMNTDINEPVGPIATKYLIAIFNLLSHGTTYLLFTTWDTFSSIGIDEIDYLSKIYDRILSESRDEKNLEECAKLSLILSDRNTLYSDGIEELSYHITKEEKVKIISILNKEIADLRHKEHYDYIIECYYEGMLYLYFSCDLMSEGIENFLNNSTSELEVKLFIILEILDRLNYSEEWVKLYEKYKNKVDYREELIENYKNKINKK